MHSRYLPITPAEVQSLAGSLPKELHFPFIKSYAGVDSSKPFKKKWLFIRSEANSFFDCTAQLVGS